jgi:hypothetical protein
MQYYFKNGSPSISGDQIYQFIAFCLVFIYFLLGIKDLNIGKFFDGNS